MGSFDTLKLKHKKGIYSGVQWRVLGKRSSGRGNPYAWLEALNDGTVSLNGNRIVKGQQITIMDWDLRVVKSAAGSG